MTRPALTIASDDVTRYRGDSVPPAPRLSIVVMAIHSDPRALIAATSIFDAPDAEIIVVNTGRGSLHPLLEPMLDRLVLVESPNLRLPGGTRNLGLAEARAPIIAFLAADCIAAPGWVEQRIAAHKNHPVVASALLPAPLAEGRVTVAARAAHILLHGLRAPHVPEAQALRFGASYRRDLFDHHGRFVEDRLLGEDSEFNTRLGVQPHWAPEIVTLHHYPATSGKALADSFERGRRRHDWLRVHGDRPTRRSIRIARDNLVQSFGLIVGAPKEKRRTMLAAAPMVCCLVVAFALGALSRAGR